MLGPGCFGETFSRVFEPDEFTVSGLSVGPRSDEVLSAVTVHIDPVAHVVKVSRLLGADLESASSQGNV
jgi:hypothetical protein